MIGTQIPRVSEVGVASRAGWEPPKGAYSERGMRLAEVGEGRRSD